MSKWFWLNTSVFVFFLLSAKILLVIFLTQSAGIQVTLIQSIYWSIDKSWLMVRIATQLLASLVGVAVLIFLRGQIVSAKSIQYGIYFSFIGLILGLIVFYGYSCCYTPVLFLLGFPFSWLRGLSNANNRLAVPITSYLLQNISSIKWYPDMFSLVSDLLFWYAIGVIYFLFAKRSGFLRSGRSLPAIHE